MTPDGIEKLKIHEELRLKAYDDATGKELRPGDTLKGALTIGWGHNLSANGITQRNAIAWLTEDIEKATAQCRQAFDWLDLLDPVRQDVIIQLAFNMGLAGLKTFKKFLAACEQQDWSLAVNELLDSKWATQVGKERVDDILNAIEYGVWD